MDVQNRVLTGLTDSSELALVSVTSASNYPRGGSTVAVAARRWSRLGMPGTPLVNSSLTAAPHGITYSRLELTW